MDFTYTETQDMIRDTLARFLGDTYDFETRQEVASLSEEGRDPGDLDARWRTELGMLGASFCRRAWRPWRRRARKHAIIMEELGKVHRASSPICQTVVIGRRRAEARVGGAIGDDKFIP